MQEKTIFIANDGTRFERREDCLKWDAISERVEKLMHARRELQAGMDAQFWDLPPGLRDLKTLLYEFFSSEENTDVFLGTYFLEEPEKRLKNFQALNLLSNYIFYGAANPRVGDF